jgi:TonB family protein
LRQVFLITCFSLLIGTVLVACNSARPGQVANQGPLQSGIDAYTAYSEGDCEAIDTYMREIAVHKVDMDDSSNGELFSSALLLESFCAELQGDVVRARKIYRRLLRESPLSFAAADARERLRVFRLREEVSDYEEQIAASRVRAIGGSTDRAPVKRKPADYPPLAMWADINGRAVVEFGVTPRGDTHSAVVVDSDPPLIFDGAALRAIRGWRYAIDVDGSESRRQAIRIIFNPEDGYLNDAERALSGSAD